MPQKRKIITTILVFLVLLFFPDLDAASDEVDLTSLPVGDGKISNRPEVGSVWSCSTSFRIPGPNSKVGERFFELWNKKELQETHSGNNAQQKLVSGKDSLNKKKKKKI